MPTTSNFGWTTPADTDLVKDGAAAIRTLGNGVDASLVDLKGGTTGQVLSKATNTDLDYTWITPNVGDITEVQAGTGISVASGTGPIPVVTNTVATAFDAAGDLVYGTGADTFTKLSLGTANQVLTVNSGATAPEWKTPSNVSTFVGVVARKIVAQSTSSGTATAVTFTKEIIDTDGFHSNDTNTSRFTIPSGKGGKYMIAARAHYQANASNQRRALIYKNGVEVDGAQTFAGADQATCQITSVLDLVATDYIELFAYQNSGTTLDVFGDDNGFTSVQMYLIGA